MASPSFQALPISLKLTRYFPDDSRRQGRSARKPANLPSYREGWEPHLPRAHRVLVSPLCLDVGSHRPSTLCGVPQISGNKPQSTGGYRDGYICIYMFPVLQTVAKDNTNLNNVSCNKAFVPYDYNQRPRLRQQKDGGETSATGSTGPEGKKRVSGRNYVEHNNRLLLGWSCTFYSRAWSETCNMHKKKGKKEVEHAASFADARKRPGGLVCAWAPLKEKSNTYMRGGWGAGTFLDSSPGRYEHGGEDKNSDNTQSRDYEQEPGAFEDLEDFYPEVVYWFFPDRSFPPFMHYRPRFMHSCP